MKYVVIALLLSVATTTFSFPDQTNAGKKTDTPVPFVTASVAHQLKDEININNETEKIPSVTEIIPEPTAPNPPSPNPPSPNPPSPNPSPEPTPSTVKPSTKPSNISTTSTTPPPTTTTVKPSPSTTSSPSPTTVVPKTSTITPSSPKPIDTTTVPPSHNRKFDGPSFVGGIVLALGLVAIGFVAFKFYKARTESNYHTL